VYIPPHTYFLACPQAKNIEKIERSYGKKQPLMRGLASLASALVLRLELDHANVILLRN